LKKGTIEAIVTAALVIVLVVVVLAKLGGKGNAANRKAPEEPTGPPPGAKKVLARINDLKSKAARADPTRKERQRQRASLPWGRDPFFVNEHASAEKPVPKPPLVCKGISSLDGEPVVLINAAVLREGETIKGYLVKQIAEDRVVLAKGGQTYVLIVGEE